MEPFLFSQGEPLPTVFAGQELRSLPGHSRRDLCGGGDRIRTSGLVVCELPAVSVGSHRDPEYTLSENKKPPPRREAAAGRGPRETRGSVRDLREGAAFERALEEEAAFAVGGAAEGQGEDVAQILGEVDLEGVAHLLRQILEVGLVVLGEQDLGDPRPARRPGPSP